MTAASSLISELRGTLGEESARIQREFAATGDGRAALAQRTQLIEEILQKLWRDLVAVMHHALVVDPLVDRGRPGAGAGTEHNQ